MGGFARIAVATVLVGTGALAGVPGAPAAPATSEPTEPPIVTTVSSHVPPVNVGFTVTATVTCAERSNGSAELRWAVRDVTTDEIVFAAAFEAAERAVTGEGSTLTAAHTLPPDTLTVGTPYLVTTSVRGPDCVGAATGWRAPEVLVLASPPASAPEPVTAVRVTPADGSVTVRWTAPASDGGSPIVGYVALAAPGGASCLSAIDTCVLGGLANGTSYTVTVTALNAAGPSPVSAPSAVVTPFRAPDAPANVAPVGGDGLAVVPWEPPAFDGGRDVTAYVATAAPGGASCLSPTPGCIVTGLDNGTEYTFTVSALNAAGWSPPSAPSEAIAAFAAPGSPTDVTAVPADGEADVSWTAPASDGGSPITGYTATAAPGGATCTTTTTECTVTGLTNGTAYTFTVTATNADGTSAPSAASAPVTPAAAPAPPVDPVMELVLDFETGASVADAKVTARGEGAKPGAPLTITVYSTPQVIGTMVIPADGAFSLTASLPGDLDAGVHSIVGATLAADGTALEQTATFVVDENGTIVGDDLATTGSDPRSALVAAGFLVVVGLGLCLSRRAHLPAFARRVRQPPS